ncbi:Cell division protein FtsQ [hydrothermal vent metagenome]|uniref:Cell division protein FtsQ n=1 Tax=hydrothermal vent metagenome TaxID=652676 RepID=A0A3B0WBT4_9ZZZZ
MKRFILIVVFLVVLLGAWGVSWLFTDKESPLFKPIAHYELTGKFVYFQPEEANQILERYLGESFWSVELSKIQTELIGLNWISQAVVRRHWPNQISVSIEEQVPVARWGERGLINQSGEVFFSENRAGFEHLVHLNGELSESVKVLTSLKRFQEKLDLIGFGILSLSYRMDEVWRIALLNGSQIVLDTKESHHKLDRFIAAYPQLANALRKSPQVYDLRYSNGFIVGEPP